MAECNVLIVGAGISGLTAGALLADEGRKVLVLEKGRQRSEEGHPPRPTKANQWNAHRIIPPGRDISRMSSQKLAKLFPRCYRVNFRRSFTGMARGSHGWVRGMMKH